MSVKNQHIISQEKALSEPPLSPMNHCIADNPQGGTDSNANKFLITIAERQGPKVPWLSRGRVRSSLTFAIHFGNKNHTSKVKPMGGNPNPQDLKIATIQNVMGESATHAPGSIRNAIRTRSRPPINNTTKQEIIPTHGLKALRTPLDKTSKGVSSLNAATPIIKNRLPVPAKFTKRILR
jgi:hypothetical protein